MHENLRKMCDGYKCISGKMPITKKEKELQLERLQEVIVEVREDWQAVPLGVANTEKKTRLYKKLRHLMQKERVLRDSL